ncbi:Short-chain dehydrogenase involved in D-alanine esterification of teichoic acids [Pseudomonas sp. 43mfcvi1.1]|jgi:short-subunit dehydrogenase involved in D-alanine esterification of teichoic acids|uniref:SDR family oxidoreductase n=1 Tax=unclassified Pseudomonas TaxID=196821 RepID=UPI000D6D8BAF|nr:MULTISPECIES: SDR family oxidoreductase [unclassified Pseudomonas]PWJ32649.1 short-subunit dehydrogenase involved in D-alanine esterification of teichoic acids [Pseudomonas sp. 43mfcvi1.1]BBH33365.1 short-chain dehydrogenase [Pseudomonas sp. St290]SSB98704.1 Short-chain dehydrogenase involved in D-alanine esterification of teichoic acids [Pseudomonas sp. 43mfcvi1.1]
MNGTGNTILVTGGTSGIGLGLALRLHQAGNKVIIAGRRKALLDKIASEHPGIESVLLDICDPHSIQRSSEALAISHPNLNVLINNAGIMQWENLTEPQGLRTAEDIVTTNLLGTIRMVYAFTPQLLKQPSATIMNVSSALAFVPLPATPTYSATKAAVHSFTQSLRVQLEDSSVEVIELAPPGVRTTLLGQENDEHAMPLEEFLDEILELLKISPTPSELVVERAKPLRFAEATGSHDEVLKMLAAYKPPAE